MTLTCTKPFPKRTFLPGVYVNEVTIVKAEDISGQTLPFLQNPFELGLKLTLDIGRDFQPDMIIAGNMKRDPDTNEVTGWGSGFVVQEALTRFGYSGPLTDENKIPPEVIESLVGQSFYRLSYVAGVRDNGKLRYYDWNIISTLEEGAYE